MADAIEKEQIEAAKTPCQPSVRPLYGRREILSDVDEVTPANVREVVSKALNVHNLNKADIEYLYNVYKGKQDILSRVKEVRPEICNNVVVNRANEVVSFKTSYLMGEPVQCVSSASAKAGATEKLVTLNEYMRMEGKAGKDMELANWFHICGVAYRLVLPDSMSQDPQGSPFNIYTLDPRDTFVIKSSGVDRRPLAGVYITRRKEKPDLVSVYTKQYYMLFEYDLLASVPPEVKVEDTNNVEVPVIEYVHNQARMGAFEPVLSQLDKINVVESNRVDAIEQTVQALLVFENCDIDGNKYDELRQRGALTVKSTSGLPAKVYAIKNELEQNGVQQTIDDLQASIYDICGMPSTQNGGASTSDTGSAVMLRDGWQQAEARAKETEKYFDRAEQRLLRIVLDICKNTRDIVLDPSEIKLQFTRRNYADLMTKAQVLTTLLSSGKVAPKLAFEVCTLFTDPDAAYQISLPYIEKAEQSAAQMQAADEPTETNSGDKAAQPGTETQQ